MAMENTVTYTVSAAGSSNVYDVAGLATVSIQGVFNTFTGLINFQGSIDGVNWNQIPYYTSTGNVGSTGQVTYTAQAGNLLYNVSTMGISHFRINIQTYTAGSVIYYITLNNSGTSNVVGISNTISVNTSPATPSPALILNSSATTNATLVRAVAGSIFSVILSNNGAAAAYFKIYNKASAPTVGTDTPVAVFAIPPSGQVVYDFAQGWRFATGVGFAITNLIADADATAVAAGQVKVYLVTN